MAVKIIYSTSADALAAHLATSLEESKSEILFPDFIITSGQGMNDWLKQSIAELKGIAANLVFLKSDDLLKLIYSAAGVKTKNEDMLSKMHLQWMIFDIFQTQEFAETFPAVYAYYEGEEFKRFALAEKSAGLFKKYESYIPDQLAEWECNGNPDEDWQIFLWKEINKRTKEKLNTDISLLNKLRLLLKDERYQNNLTEEIGTLYFFGRSEFTPFQIELINAVSPYIKVKIYLLNTAATYQGDKYEFKNELLKNWGHGYAKMNSLFSRPPFEIEILQENTGETSSTLLQNIQQNIVHNCNESLTSKYIMDRSITVNSCFTPIREVEVLYNYLVKTINEDEGRKIGARDILIYCTDIDKYAPAIKAVFDNSPYHFPYGIAGMTYTATDSVYNAVEQLLLIQEEDFTSEKVMRLLEFPCIKKCFEITDPSRLRRLVNEANIRRSLDGNKDDETIYSSWTYGLKRMLYGLCISETDELDIDGEQLFLMDNTEGYDSFDVVRLYKFVNLLHENIRSRKEKKTIAEWVEFTNHLIEDFVETEYDEELVWLNKSISVLNEADGEVKEKISFEIFRKQVVILLEELNSEREKLRGGILFCPIGYACGAPFKVVGMLGIDFDKFPAGDSTLSFDLSAETKENFSGSNKMKDKLFFLETFLSASDKLFLSYIGKSVKDNSEIPPSSVVDELIAYIKKYAAITESSDIIINHPLHNFNAKYFSDDERFYSFLEKKTDFEAGSPPAASSLKPGNDDQTIPLHSFINFFKDPFKHHYNKVLGIYYSDQSELLEESELFNLDSLQGWALKHELLKNSDSIEEFRLKKVKTGKLPLRNIGMMEAEKNEAEIAVMKQRLKEFIAGKEETTIPLTVDLKTKTVSGKLTSVYEDNYIFNCVSSSTDKYRLECWIICLLIAASEKKLNLLFNSINNDSIITIESNYYTTDEARTILDKLYWFYEESRQSILSFSIEFLDLAEKLDSLDDVSLKNEIIKKANSWSGFRSEYLKIEYENGFFEKEENIEKLRETLTEIAPHIKRMFP